MPVREALERSFGVTAFGTFLLIRALMPMIRQARGRIVNVGAGRLPLPLLGPGFGAKLAMEAMSDILRVELRTTGVKVSIVEPGMTRWEDVESQLAVYAQGFDDALSNVAPQDRPRFEGRGPTLQDAKSPHDGDRRPRRSGRGDDSARHHGSASARTISLRLGAEGRLVDGTPDH